MESQHKGQIAELKVALRAAEKGFVVSKPLIDARYDFIIDTGTDLLRTQVKYANGKHSHSSGAVTIRLRSHKAKGKACYSNKEVDLLLVYVPKIQSIVSFKADEFCGKPAIILRLEPTKNSQKSKVWLASERLW